MANILPIIRVLIGTVFVVSGYEKLIGPYQNFLYVIQSYEVLSVPLEEAVARIFPWIELFLGIFLVVGLWLSLSLKGVIVMLLSFIIIVSQAIVRKLPIDECGCFGQMISLPLKGVLTFDTCLLVLTLVLVFKLDPASRFSVDKYFEKAV